MFIRHVFSARVVLYVFSSSAWRGEGLHGARDCTGRLDSYQSGSRRQMLDIYNVCLFTKMFGYLVSFIRLNRSLLIFHLRIKMYIVSLIVLLFITTFYYVFIYALIYVCNRVLVIKMMKMKTTYQCQMLPTDLTGLYFAVILNPTIYF